MKKICDLFLKTTNALDSVSTLLARLVLGLVFLPAGWGKLHDPNKIIGFFQSLGIPYPHIQAPFVATVETVGGLALLLGVATRLAAAPLMVIMVVAIATAHASSLESWKDLLDLTDFLYLALLFLLLTRGGGCLSVDALIQKYRRGKSGGHANTHKAL